MVAFNVIGIASVQAPLPEAVEGSVTASQLLNDQWQLDYKLDRPVNSIMLGPPTPQYRAQASDLPGTYEILTHPQIGFCFLERRDKSAFAEVSFQIKTGCEVVHYAPQPFVDLGHGIGPNTGP